MSLTSIASINNNITGLIDQTKSAIFVINVQNGNNLDVYQKQFGVTDAKVLLKVFRFMVQDYILGGLTQTKDAQSWIYGSASSIFDTVSSGDFYKGNVKDLNNFVTPIFNFKTDKVQNSLMWINSGASDPYQVGEVQQLNNKPYLNTLTQIYDGSQISS